VRLNGHARFLLMSIVPDHKSLHESEPKSTPLLIVRRSNTVLHYCTLIGLNSNRQSGIIWGFYRAPVRRPAH
jgi:hypothetical protein